MQGLANIDRHVSNIRNHYGLPVIVALNRFGSDTDKELKLVSSTSPSKTCKLSSVSTLQRARRAPWISRARWSKVATGRNPEAEVRLRRRGHALEEDRQSREKHLPRERGGRRHRRCARRSRSTKRTATATCRSVSRKRSTHSPRIHSCAAHRAATCSTCATCICTAGAEFMVVLSGDIMTMPGLPKKPAADGIDIDDNGEIVGLS